MTCWLFLPALGWQRLPSKVSLGSCISCGGCRAERGQGLLPAGDHPSLAELQCPSCLLSATALLVPALPKGFFYGERGLTTVTPGPTQVFWGCAVSCGLLVSLTTPLRFPWFKDSPSASLWGAPLPMVPALELLPRQLLLGSLMPPRILRPVNFLFPPIV